MTNNSKSQNFYIHLISDSTGETLSSILRSVMSQFENVAITIKTWSLIRTKGQMERVAKDIAKNPGIILHTIIDHNLQVILKKTCNELKLPCISALSRFTKEFANFFNIEPKEIVGKQYQLDETYFERIEAVNYTLAHDDGQNAGDLDEADLILVGVSRTSKTPTCVYLSNKGYKAANIPFVKKELLPDSLFEVKNIFICGLVISPERLIQIRKSRLGEIKFDDVGNSSNVNYTDMDLIKKEILEARRLFVKHGWPVIDVTKKSIEEISANILQLKQSFDEG